MANRKKRLEKERAAYVREAAFRRRLREGKRRHQPVPPITPEQRELLFAVRFRASRLPDVYRQSWLDGLCHDLCNFLRHPLGANRGIYADAEAIVDDLLRHPRMTELLYEKTYRDRIIWLIRCSAVVRRIEEWRAPRSRDPEVMLRSFLLHVMAPYPNEMLPVVKADLLCDAFEYKLYYCSRRQKWITRQGWVDLNIHLAGGKNIRHYYSQLKLPRKTQYYLLRAPRGLALHQAIHFAIFRALGIGRALSRGMTHFLSCLYELETYRDLLLFIARYPELSLEEVEAICRFFEHQVEGELYVGEQKIKPMYLSFSFKGRTLQSVLRIIREWEAYIQAQLHANHPEPYPEPAIAGYEDEGFTIRRLRDWGALVEEGWRMQHCVATYHRACLNGTSIWSVRRQIPDKTAPKRMATIEVRRGKVCEVQGKCNTTPTVKTKQVIKRWMKQEGLVWGG